MPDDRITQNSVICRRGHEGHDDRAEFCFQCGVPLKPSEMDLEAQLSNAARQLAHWWDRSGKPDRNWKHAVRWLDGDTNAEVTLRLEFWQGEDG